MLASFSEKLHRRLEWTQTHNHLLTCAVLTSRPTSLPDVDKPARVLHIISVGISICVFLRHFKELSIQCVIDTSVNGKNSINCFHFQLLCWSHTGFPVRPPSHCQSQEGHRRAGLQTRPARLGGLAGAPAPTRSRQTPELQKRLDVICHGPRSSCQSPSLLCWE